METIMQKQRRLETAEDRDRRLVRDAQLKRSEEAANEAAVDRMIRRNIEQHGP
jgi:hypothetical protein